MSKNLRRFVVVCFMLLLSGGVIMFVIFNDFPDEVIVFTKAFLALVALLLFLFALPSLILLPALRKRDLSFFKLMLYAYLAYALVVTAVVSLLLVVGVPKSTSLQDLGIIKKGQPILLLSFASTVVTLLTAGVSAFILMGQIYSEERHEQRSKDQGEEIDEDGALAEFRRWTKNPRVSRITGFGSFSVIPGFWKDPTPKSHTEFLKFIKTKSRIRFFLIGPKPESILELIGYLKSPAVKEEFEEMKKWSDVATFFIDDRGTQYESCCNSLKKENEHLLCLISRPWEKCAVTFLVAENDYGDCISSIFFGSPHPDDGFSPGERHNILQAPRIFINRRREVGSLLVNLRALLEVVARDECKQSPS